MPVHADFRRDQQVEQQDHREGQHEVGEERQEGVQPAAEVARGQAQRDAHHEGEERGRGRDGQHRPRAHHHAAEDVAGQVVAAQAGTRRSRLGPVGRAGVPGRAFFMPETCASGSWVMMMSAKKAVKTQNITMPKPTMPTGLSKSLP